MENPNSRTKEAKRIRIVLLGFKIGGKNE